MHERQKSGDSETLVQPRAPASFSGRIQPDPLFSFLMARGPHESLLVREIPDDRVVSSATVNPGLKK